MVLNEAKALMKARLWRAAVVAPASLPLTPPVVSRVLPVAQLLAVGVVLVPLPALFPAAVAVSVRPAVPARQLATSWPTSPMTSYPGSRSWEVARLGTCGTTHGQARTLQ